MDYLLHALVTLFVTVDPIGLAPMFMVLTAGCGPVSRRQTAIRASVTAGAILIAFALIGDPLIGFLGISLAAFRIAGGLLLFVIAFEMVFERRIERKAVTAEKVSSFEDSRSIAIFPLAVSTPLIVPIRVCWARAPEQRKGMAAAPAKIIFAIFTFVSRLGAIAIRKTPRRNSGV